jgi:hypothetical protein
MVISARHHSCRNIRDGAAPSGAQNLEKWNVMAIRIAARDPRRTQRDQ